MKKFLLTFLISIQFLTAQEAAFNFEANLNQNSEVFNIVDEASGNTILFTLKGRNLEGFLFNDNFEEKGSIKADKIPNKFDIFSGYIVNENKISLFLSNTNRTQFAKIIFDFDSGESNFNDLSIKLDRERFLKSISHNNSLLILTVPYDQEAIKVYKYAQTNSPTTALINFSNTHFLNKKNKPTKFYDLFKNPRSRTVELGKMEENRPNSIQEASMHIKSLVSDDQLALMLDENHYFTYLLNIDLNKLEGTAERIEKPRLSEELDHKSSNSFLLNNKLYQVITTKDALKFHVVDLENKNVINEHVAEKGKEIYFKNTPIVQEGGAYTSHREYEKTAKFIRKMKNLPIAITAVEKDGLYQINMGSNLEVNTNPMMMGMMGGMGSMAGGMAAGFNPMLTGYFSYGFSRTVEINGLFDKNFEHTEGDIEPNIFDKIKEVSGNFNNISAETIFEKDGAYFWGAYFTELGTYSIYRI